MVEYEFSKLGTRVRFSSPAPESDSVLLRQTRAKLDLANDCILHI